MRRDGGRTGARKGGWFHSTLVKCRLSPVRRPPALLAALFLCAGASWLGAEEQGVALKSETSRGARLPEMTDQILLLELRIERLGAELRNARAESGRLPAPTGPSAATPAPDPA